MDREAFRGRRRALGYTQEQFGAELGISGDYVGQLERGAASISPALARAARTIRPRGKPVMPKTSDPMERIVEEALIDAGIRYNTDHGGGTEHRLDFELPDLGVAIEVKRMHTPRSIEQLARAPNVILAQGEVAIRFLAAAIRSGDFLEMCASGTR